MESRDPLLVHASSAPSREPQLFVSYASVDRERVLPVVDALREMGLSIWIDQSGIAGGAAYGTEIANAIKGSGAVVLMCSAASLASRNVHQEIMLAWRYDRPIVPLLLEPTTFPDDVAYWLEGAQWIVVHDRPCESWLDDVGRALARHGVMAALRSPAGEPPPAARALTMIPGNLPPLDKPAIGRERETRELLALLRQGRWVTLVGPGGAGKTRLALDVAQRAAADLPGGAWLVDLADLRAPHDVLPAIAAALGIKEAPDGDLLAAVTKHLDQARLLLLLDNMEQIVAGAAEAARLLDRCEGMVVLATSRTPLRVPGEWVYQVGPLALPDLANLPPPAMLEAVPAVRLFVERAREARRDFVLTEGLARPVAEICQRLDGLPLAIELAAARVRLLTPAAILTRLGSRLNLLTRGSAAAARQQTLRDTIAWSHELLTDTERIAFRRLAVFAGGMLVDAAERMLEAIPGTTDATLDDISELINHSLLRVEHAGPEDEPRMRMLETIREFALEQLVASGEANTLRSAHARFFHDLVLANEAGLLSAQPDDSLARLLAEEDNIRIALDHLAESDADAELEMTAALVRYWRQLGRYHGAAERLQAALDHAPVGDPAARAKVMQGLGFIAARRGEAAVARRWFEASLALRREIGDRAAEAHTLQNLAELAEERGDLTEARAQRETVLAIRTELGDEAAIAIARHDLGLVELLRGDYAAAIARFTESLPLFRRNADARNLAGALNLLAAAEMLSGQGDAVRHAEESLALWSTLDDRFAVDYARVNYGRALQLAGRFQEAIPVLTQACASCREQKDAGGISLALYGLGLIAHEQGREADALAVLAESLELAHVAGEPWHIAERLEALAGLWAETDAEFAARIAGCAAHLRETAAMPLPPAERPAAEAVMSRLRDALGEDRLDTAMAAGAGMPAAELIGTVLAAAGRR